MLHDFSPFIWEFSDNFGIRWYGLSYLLAFFIAYLLLVWIARRQNYGLLPKMVDSLVTYGALGVLLGGRLGYCVLYDPDLFLHFTDSFPFWGVLAVHEGGMSSHGGIIGLVIALTLFSKKHGINQLYLFDLAAFSAPLGIFLGRIANFINGELVGRPCSSFFPLAVRFPQDILQWPTFESQKLVSLTSLVNKIPGYSSERWMEWIEKYKTNIDAKNSLISGLYRIIEEVQNGNIFVKTNLAPLLTPRHPSQLYSALGEGLFMFVFLFILWRRARKPGTIAYSFLIVYSLVRIVDEAFRTPDPQLGLLLFGLTWGQFLSIIMFFVGLSFSFLWGKRDSLKIAGWGKGHSVKLIRR